MKISKKWRLRVKRKTPEQLNRLKKRCKALSRPITLEQVAKFSAHLAHVDYGNDGGCWLFTGKSTSGASQVYARISHNGCLINAHRFALAVKLGCTLWDLEGYDAAHASKAVCVGGRCCRPEHLTKKLSDPNRSWDRRKDASVYGDKVTIRTPEEVQRLLAALYPFALKPSPPLFDEPWQSNASPELLAFLEIGLRGDLRNLLRGRMERAQHAQ